MKHTNSKTEIAAIIITVLEVIAIIFILALLLLENSPTLTSWFN